MCLNRDCRMEVDGGGWRWVGGPAGRSGGSGIPDTELQSVWITSHTSFRPITALTGKEAEGGGRDTDTESPQVGGEKNETVWVRTERQG